MSYAPTQSQPQPLAVLAISDPTAALDCVPESGSGATQHDAWLVSFIDILILLLALFVLLLTYQQDATGPMDKAGQNTADPATNTVAAAEPFTLALELPVLSPMRATAAQFFEFEHELADASINRANSAEAVETNLPPAEPLIEPALPAPPAVEDTVQTIEPLTPADAGSGDDTVTEAQNIQFQSATDSDDAAPASSGPMQAFLDSFNSSELRDRVEVSVHGAGVNLEISDSILFTPASAALTPSGVALLKGLAGALNAQAHPLSIEGHTDNIPIETARFPSNWELSTARAAIVARQLVKQGVAAERIRAIGYADTRPRADNLTPAGRSRNRRVSLVLQVPSRHD